MGIHRDFLEQNAELAKHAIDGRGVIKIVVKLAGSAPAFGALNHEEIQIVNGARRFGGNGSHGKTGKFPRLYEVALVDKVDAVKSGTA